jgi:PAS domain S-box-containing protein
MAQKKEKIVISYTGYISGLVDFYGNLVEKLTGYTKNELKEIKWTDIIISEDRPAARQAFKTAMGGDGTYTRVYRIRTKTGEIKWIQEWSEIIFETAGEDKQIKCVAGAIMDVSEDKTDEEERKKREAHAGKYLMLMLDNKAYGLSIKAVKEIVMLMPITAIPQAPLFVKGIINLRGKVIPIINLRQKLNIQSEYSENKVIIIAEVTSLQTRKCWEEKKCLKTECPAYENIDLRCWLIAGTHCRGEIQGTYCQKIEACRKCDIYMAAYQEKSVFTVGLIVDRVSEVMNIKADDVDEFPSLGFGKYSDWKSNIEYILGVTKSQQGVIILLDLNKLLKDEEINILQKAI